MIVDDPAKQRLEWTRKIESAKLRVDHQARSEAILGYTESSQAYRELLEELNSIKWWVLVQYHILDWGNSIMAFTASFLNWRKALISVHNGSCIEVASALKKVAVRDSKSLDGNILVYSESAWRNFIATLQE